MQSFNFNIIIYPTFIIFFIGLLISFIVTKNIILSISVSLLKSIFYFIYFAYFFDGTFTSVDDLAYLEQGQKLIDDGHSFLLLITKDFLNLTAILISLGDRHIVYYLYNMLAFELFGTYYFAPVALNIILTFLSGFILYKMLIILGFTKKISKLFYMFFVLHWDIIAWSHFMNLKDILVQFITIYLVYIIVLFEIDLVKFRHYVLFSVCIILIMFLRYYVPFFIMMSYLVYKSIFITKKIKNVDLRLVVYTFEILVIPFLILPIPSLFPYEVSELMRSFSNPIFGSIRYLLTPIPFNIDINYQFLILPAFLHWLFFPFTIYGAYVVLKLNNRIFLFMIILFVINTIFYGSYYELQGPRHRVQINFMIALFQFMGLLYFLKGNINGRKTYPHKFAH